MSFFKQFRSIIANTAPTAVVEPSPKSTQAIEQTTETVERRSRKRQNSLKGRRILIIDDSPTIIAALRKVLRSAGCITMEALNAERGLEVVRQEKPDLVFLDIVLPRMSGFAALRLMRRDPATHHIPVIMISGNEQATEQFYAKRIGADDFMKKPFSRFEVFGRIESLIELKKLASPRAAGTAEQPVAALATTLPVIAPTTPLSEPTAAKPVTAPITPAVTLPKDPPVPTPAPEKHLPTIPKPLTPLAITPLAITALEARSQLTAMGLQYFNQEQFMAAIQRGDKLALDLFIAGGGVDINV